MKRLALALTFLATSALAAPALAAEPTAPVNVDGGMIDGKALGGGVTGWLGVPFAAPPLRDLRWRAPKP